MHNLLKFNQSLQEELLRKEKVLAQNYHFLFTLGLIRQCQKTLGNVKDELYKKIETVKNLIGQSMLVQNVKAIFQESNSGDSLIFESIAKML